MNNKANTGAQGSCGMTREEEESLKRVLGEDDPYLDSGDEENDPFSESGSEYLPSNSSGNDDVDEYIEPFDNEPLDEEMPTAPSATDESESEEDVMEEPIEKDHGNINIDWTNDEFVPTFHEFDNAHSGIQGNTLNENSKDIDFFMALLNEELAEYIVVETNRYARQNATANWKDLSGQEFYVFLGMTMLMSRNKKRTIKEYWSTDLLLDTPVFKKTMPRDRFLKILANIHFANNEEEPSTRLYKIDAVLRKMKEQFQLQFHPFQNLAIDESMVLFKGRLLFKQYIKTKKHRFGIKLYVLCDCETGFVLDFIVYLGEDTKHFVESIKGLGSSGSIVASLLKPYFYKGHSIYTDNYYSSPILSNYLFDRKINSCGTVQQKRKHMPKLEPKLKKGETSWKGSDKILVVKWKDRRDVTMITTMHTNSMKTLDKIDRVTKERQIKPLCVVNYNENMGAIDRSDMMISSLECMRKSIKWYKKLFFHTVDLLLLNAHAMYTMKNPEKVPFADFQLRVIRQIFEKYPLDLSTKAQAQIRRGPDVRRLAEKHFISLVPPTDTNKAPQKRCVVCSRTKLVPKKRSDSRYMCIECNVGLCLVDCFKAYHTKIHF